MSDITFKNDLGTEVVIYDSFSSDSDTNTNYFGDLTRLTTVAGNASTVLPPKHAFASVFIVKHADNDTPIARYQWMKVRPANSFEITQANVDAMTQTAAFIAFEVAHPDDPTVKQFRDLIVDPSKPSLVKDVDAFFAAQAAYSKVTFVTYMLGITQAALSPPPPPPAVPPPPDTPPPPPMYSLSKLVSLMGGSWPDGLPDVGITSYQIEDKDGALIFWCVVELNHVPAAGPGAVAYLAKSLGLDKVRFTIIFHHALSLALFATRLVLRLDDIKIPIASGTTLTITKPEISLDINPLFKFVVFQIKGTIPFTIYGKKFNATANFTIDNVEAEVGVVIDADASTTLPGPPGLKGVHFDEFGVNMGIMFEPLGYVVGIQGKFHIGDDGKNVVAVDDDTFALILEFEGDVPNPIYGSFYVPKMDLATLLTVFTNSNTGIDIPVHFTDMSFVWSENPMEPIVLPDGSMSDMALGFSAGIQILNYGFYGKVRVDLSSGLTADVESSPIELGSIFKLEGDGKGVKIKVDKQGHPIKNNAVRDQATLKALLADATDKVMVSPGGPVLTIQTFSSPFLHLNAKASLLGLVEVAVAADIDKNGISFELDFGSVLTTKLTCQLSDWHNFAGSFSYGIDKTINLPHIGSVGLGSIPLKAGVSVGIKITTSLQNVTFSATASFDFEGLHLSVPEFSVDVHIGKITDLLEALADEIENEAKSIFGDVLNDVGKWAAWVGKGFITGVTDMASALKAGFNQAMPAAVAIMKGVGVAANAVAQGAKNAYNAAAQDVASAMKAAGYVASDVGGALKDAFGAGANEVASVLKGAGYGVEAIGGALATTFSSSAADAAKALAAAGFGAADVGRGLAGTFVNGADQMASALSAAGFSPQNIADVAKNVFGASTAEAAKILSSLGVGGDAANAILNGIGYPASEVASVLKSIFSWPPFINLPLPFINLPLPFVNFIPHIKLW